MALSHTNPATNNHPEDILKDLESGFDELKQSLSDATWKNDTCMPKLKKADLLFNKVEAIIQDSETKSNDKLLSKAEAFLFRLAVFTVHMEFQISSIVSDDVFYKAI